jgi:thiamine biosynthesis lipoprotein
MSTAALPLHRVRQDHMATYFEVQVAHENEKYARQAAQAAFQVTVRMENLLSRYRENSEVSQIRRMVPDETLRLTQDTFFCLRLAAEMQQLTGGAFDPALGAQMDILRGKKTIRNDAAEPTTRGRLVMEPNNFTVCCRDAPVNLDLGAIGKGFALDRMAEELRDWEIDRALLIAGGSSLLALAGPDPDPASGWKISLSGHREFKLCHGALGASGTSVKGAHILDPRTGMPTQGPFRTWATAKSAAIADALSTAWMLLSLVEIREICQNREDLGAIIQNAENAPDDLIQISSTHLFPLTVE